MEIAIVAAALQVLGGVGAMAQANAAKEEFDRQADLEKQAGRLEVAQIRRNKSRLLAAQSAAFNAMGIGTLGNALDVIQDTATEQELAAQIANSNSSQRARNLRQQGFTAKAQGRLKFVQSMGNAASTLAAGGVGQGGGTPTTAGGAPSGGMSMQAPQMSFANQSFVPSSQSRFSRGISAR